ncbi:hypothetical protein D6783_04870 [Candidatus Woesearchaeota archaeon]|nr:MAG: hypothetical protein D6783_04870 [Candidatus Woesearchaeota archaeon]
MIKHLSLRHGWWYHYRIHVEKARALCAPPLFQPLYEYLEGMFRHCPDEKFLTGPRSSKFKFPLGISPTPLPHHPICTLAKEGLARNEYNTAHSNVQMFLLQHDASTVGIEVPVWLDPHEDSFLARLQKTGEESGPLSGHIDVLSIENGIIWVWDYKPRAEKERYATTQTLFYARMLSRRTNIPLNLIRCGYFDEQHCFVFNPADIAHHQEQQGRTNKTPVHTMTL